MTDSVDSIHDGAVRDDPVTGTDDDAVLSARARRRRDEAADSGRLSVADLLARHGAEGAAPARRSHRLRAEDDDEPDEPAAFHPDAEPSEPDPGFAAAEAAAPAESGYGADDSFEPVAASGYVEPSGYAESVEPVAASGYDEAAYRYDGSAGDAEADSSGDDAEGYRLDDTGVESAAQVGAAGAQPYGPAGAELPDAAPERAYDRGPSGDGPSSLLSVLDEVGLPRLSQPAPPRSSDDADDRPTTQHPAVPADGPPPASALAPPAPSRPPGLAPNRPPVPPGPAASTRPPVPPFAGAPSAPVAPPPGLPGSGFVDPRERADQAEPTEIINRVAAPSGPPPDRARASSDDRRTSRPGPNGSGPGAGVPGPAGPVGRTGASPAVLGTGAQRPADGTGAQRPMNGAGRTGASPAVNGTGAQRSVNGPGAGVPGPAGPVGRTGANPAVNGTGAQRSVNGVDPGAGARGATEPDEVDDEPPAIRGRAYLPALGAAVAPLGVPRADLTGEPDPAAAHPDAERADLAGERGYYDRYAAGDGSDTGTPVRPAEDPDSTVVFASELADRRSARPPGPADGRGPVRPGPPEDAAPGAPEHHTPGAPEHHAPGAIGDGAPGAAGTTAGRGPGFAGPPAADPGPTPAGALPARRPAVDEDDDLEEQRRYYDRFAAEDEGRAAPSVAADPPRADRPADPGRNAVGPNGVGLSSAAPNGIGPSGIGPTGVGPNGVGRDGEGHADGSPRRPGDRRDPRSAGGREPSDPHQQPRGGGAPGRRRLRPVEPGPDAPGERPERGALVGRTERGRRVAAPDVDDRTRRGPDDQAGPRAADPGRGVDDQPGRGAVDRAGGAAERAEATGRTESLGRVAADERARRGAADRTEAVRRVAVDGPDAQPGRGPLERTEVVRPADADAPAGPDEEPADRVAHVPPATTDERTELVRAAAPAADDPEPGDRAGDGSGEDSWAKVSVADRTAHIDQTLSRLTAIHAGLNDELLDRVSGTTRLTPVVGPAKGRGRPSRAADTGHEPPPTGDRLADLRAALWPPTRLTKIIAIAAAAVLLLVAGVGVGGNLWLNGKLHTVEALDTAAPGVVDAAAQSGDRNYLFVVSSPSDGQAPESNVSTGVESVLLAHVPAGGGRVVLLSAPANLLVDRPGCQSYDAGSESYGAGSAPAQSGVPLASAYQVGGPKCLVAQLQLLTGLAVNHYASLNLIAVRELVDQLGGLSLCVPHPVVDDALGVVAANPGRQLLGGDAALSFARAWHVRGEAEGTGQLAGQALRQQLVLTTLLNQATEHPLLHLPTTVSLVGLFGANSLVDGVRLSDLGALSSALTGTDPADVDFVGVPTAGQPDTQGNVVPSTDAAKSLFDAIRADRPLPGEGATGPAPATTEAASTTTLPPSQVTVTVRNGSTKSGLANTAADSLRGLGFQVAGVGDAPHQAGGRTVIRASSDRAAQAAALAQAVPSATVQTVTGTGTLDLVLGDDFDGQVSAAAAATPSTPTLLTAAQLSCH